jgi:methyl-accepting chemotaxis protein
MSMPSFLRFGNWSISAKLAVFTTLVSGGGLTALGLMATQQSRDAIRHQATVSLTGTVTERTDRIEQYFGIIRSQMATFAQSEQIQNALADFSAAFAALPEQTGLSTAPTAEPGRALTGYYTTEFRTRLENAGQPFRGERTYIPASEPGRIAQAMYIAQNPNPVGSKLRLDAADVSCDYNAVHAEVHPEIRRYLEAFSYYDVFLFDLNGNIVYTVFKETDFATSVEDGPYRSTGLADAFRAARNLSSPDATAIIDFRPYEPSYGAAAAFIAAPVFKDGAKIGVAAFQLPVDRINQIAGSPAGMGETGETYLLADDGRMRSQSRLTEDPTIFVQEVKTPAAERAAQRQTGTIEQVTYTGERTLAAFEPVEIDGLHWALIGEVKTAELFAPAEALSRSITVTALIVAGVGATLAVLFARSISRIIARIVGHTETLAKGDLSGTLPENRGDELGALSRAMNAMTRNMNTMISDVARTSHEVAGASTEIAASSEEMAAGLRNQERQAGEISASVQQLSMSVSEVADRSQLASESAASAGTVAADGGRIVRQTIEQIRGISEQVRVSVQAVGNLGSKSEAIGEIIGVINDIADQTNLLALNAAIEAARAGEHGRGFAVVADEVRKLAERTTTATEEVARSIREIQNETRVAVERIEESASRVDEGVSMASSAGDSLERIVATSTELQQLVRAIAEAAASQSEESERIANSTASIVAVTREASEGAGQAATAAAMLSRQSEELQQLSARFILENKGAPSRKG